MSDRILLENVRLSFPSLFQTEMYNGDDTGKYTSTFLLDKKAHAKVIEAIKAASLAAAEEHFGKPIPKAVVYGLKDGDNVDTDGYAGCYSVKAGSKKRPLVIDRDKSILAEADDKIYAGCYVNASISIWCMDNQWGKKVLFNLHAVQFNKDGETFGSSNDAALDDFQDLGSDDTAVDPFS